MADSQSSSLSQWGAIDWDEELEELCSTSEHQTDQSTTNMKTEGECLILPNDHNHAENPSTGIVTNHAPEDASYDTQVPEKAHDSEEQHSQDQDIDECFGHDHDIFSSRDGYSQATELTDSDIQALAGSFSEPVSFHRTAWDSGFQQPCYGHQGGSGQQSNIAGIPTTSASLYWAVPHHPGWTSTLSPSLSHLHSTPPEVNNWAFSAPIGYSINQELEKGCENLRRYTILCSALLHTDNFDFSGYAYPFGATGYMRVPLRKPGPAKDRQASLLQHSEETLEYTDADSTAIRENVRAQLVDIWGADSPYILQDKIKEETGIEPNNTVDEQKEMEVSAENMATPNQGKDISTPALIKTQQDKEMVLDLAKRTPLPGIDLIDDFFEDSPVSLGTPLDLLDHLTFALESADTYMAEKLKKVNEISSWTEGVLVQASDYTSDSAENIGSATPGLFDMLNETVHLLESVHIHMIAKPKDPGNATKSAGQNISKLGQHDVQQESATIMETHESNEEKLQSSLSVVSRIGVFIRECWKGNPTVLE
ncbi:hypothetical protein HDK64DRAFT_252201 [Phyllosticta capitalensis]